MVGNTMIASTLQKKLKTPSLHAPNQVATTAAGIVTAVSTTAGVNGAMLRNAETTATTDAVHPDQKPSRFLTCNSSNNSASGDRARAVLTFRRTVVGHQQLSTGQ